MMVIRSCSSMASARSQKRSSEPPRWAAVRSSRARTPGSRAPSIWIRCSSERAVGRGSRGTSTSARRSRQPRPWPRSPSPGRRAAPASASRRPARRPRRVSSTARSTMCHSGRLSDSSMTRSPEPTPSSPRDSASAQVWRKNSPVVQAPASVGCPVGVVVAAGRLDVVAVEIEDCPVGHVTAPSPRVNCSVARGGGEEGRRERGNGRRERGDVVRREGRRRNIEPESQV